MKPLILLIILIAAAGFIMYLVDLYKTEVNVKKAGTELIRNNFSAFYQKQGNRFCARAESEFEQENIVDDMLWVLGDVEFREIKKVGCENGSKGILIK